MTRHQCLLGIDIGGISVKAFICDDLGKKISMAEVSTSPAYKNKNKKLDCGPQRDFDAECLWDITREAIAKVLLQIPPEYMVISVAVSSCGCTMLALDAKDCQISLCENSVYLQKEYEVYKNEFSNEEFTNITGYPLGIETTGLHLSSLYNRQFDVMKKVDKIFSVDDFIVYKLTNCFLRNYSTAASNGMWDSKKSEWLDFFMNRSGISKKVLGEICDSGVALGKVSSKASIETGLSQDVIVSTGGMDYQCAAFAIDTHIENNIFNITGTIDLIITYNSFNKSSKHPIMRSINDFHVIPNRESKMLEAIGAAQTEWLKNNIVANTKYNFNISWDDYFKEIENSYKQHLFSSEIFLPEVFGSYIPEVDFESTGLYGGLNQNTNGASLLRATIEGMAFQTKKMYDYVKDDRPDNKLVLVGGGSKNQTWKQIKADVLGVDIVSPNIETASAMGAALLGGVGASVYSDYKEASSVTKDLSCSYVAHNQNRTEYYNEILENVYIPLEKEWKKINKNISEINKKYRDKNEII